MSGSDLQVQTVIRDAEVEFVTGWARSLDAAVAAARRNGCVGRVTVAMADSRVLNDTPGVLTPDRPLTGSIDEWRVERLTPGTGRYVGHNLLLGASPAGLILSVDASVYLSPSCLGELIGAIHEPNVGLVEPRHIPLGSRQEYDVHTGDTSWVSSACCLLRREVLGDIGDFDSDAFPTEGADVDLSWRARLAGWHVRYVPWCAAFLHSSDANGTQAVGRDVIETEVAKLVLASKFGGEPLAKSWVQAWSARGSIEQRSAAAMFRAIDPRDLPERLVGPTDVYIEELFARETLSNPVDEPYAWHVKATGTTRVRADPPPARSARAPFLSVVVRTQGRRLPQLEDNLLSLAGQTCQDFEVLLVGHDLDDARQAAIGDLVGLFPVEFARRVRRLDASGGSRARPLNVAVAQAAGRYVAFLDDDDVAFGRWVETFRKVADERPEAVVWTQVAWQTVGSSSCAGRETSTVIEPPQLFVREFDLFAHLRENGTPNCALAIPVACFREEGVRFREDLPVFEDWDLLLQLAQLRPIRSTGSVTALYRRGSSGNSGDVHAPEDWDDASSRVLDDLDRRSFLVRGEYLPLLRRSMDDLDRLREEQPVREHLRGGVHPEDHDYTDELVPARPLAERRAVIISTHLDDAVLSCGDLAWQLPSCAILTVFAGDDVDWSQLTEWDEGSGFTAGTNVMALRTAEDDAALEALGATAMRLAFLDSQYREPGIAPAADVLCREIEQAINELGADTVFFPLGLGHVDHRLTAAGAALAARNNPHLDWFAYQDLPYAYEVTDTSEALSAIRDMTPVPVRLTAVSDLARKGAAIDAYRSQIMALGRARRALAMRVERYWALTPSSDGESISG